MDKLESAQLQVLKKILEATDTHTDIQADEVDEIVVFLEKQNLIAPKGGGWTITEEGRTQLEQEQNAVGQRRTGNVQSWLSLSIATAALVVSVLALLSK